ncbi:3-dehydroquinate synthase [uncultured archaeon]|nr:3-dehydroquinate synthase [uncultured archaeon]
MEIIVNTEAKCKIIIRRGQVKDDKLPEGFVITDTNLYHYYKDLISSENYIIKAGEESKSLENYFKILNNVNRDTIVAFGGGVTGDLAGFIASTYKRGINLIQVPTSLVAMTDSSIGGKNGVNLGEKKNYVGTIYQPALILIDPELLKTLPEKEFKNGLAEVIKYGHLFGSPSLKLVSSKNLSDEDIEKIIIECCKNKVKIVEKDQFDKGYRHILNFGHTVGHAIEILYNLSHGEAISIGMIKELEIGNRLGIIDKKQIENLKNALVSVGLPIELPKDLDVDKVLKIMKSDKKGKFKFAFDEKNYDYYVEEETVRECLK